MCSVVMPIVLKDMGIQLKWNLGVASAQLWACFGTIHEAYLALTIDVYK